MTEVCDMFFETELSEKLNSELESAGISVSEALISKTLAAVQAAKDNEAKNEVENEIQQGIETLAELRKAKRVSVRSALFRAASIMAACFVLVVGGFALRFSTMRMGKEEAAPMAPMVTDGNGSARNGITYAADADSIAIGEDYYAYSEPLEAQIEQEIVEAETPACEVMEPIEPTVESDSADDAVKEESEQEKVMAEMSEVQNAVTLLTERLAQAEAVGMRRNAEGVRVYEFFVRDSAGVPGYYWVFEDGLVKFAEVPPEGQTNTMEDLDGSENREFRRAVLVWMKEHGYSF